MHRIVAPSLDKYLRQLDEIAVTKAVTREERISILNSKFWEELNPNGSYQPDYTSAEVYDLWLAVRNFAPFSPNLEA
jgi:hypothetical protein